MFQIQAKGVAGIAIKVRIVPPRRHALSSGILVLGVITVTASILLIARIASCFQREKREPIETLSDLLSKDVPTAANHSGKISTFARMSEKHKNNVLDIASEISYPDYHRFHIFRGQKKEGKTAYFGSFRNKETKLALDKWFANHTGRSIDCRYYDVKNGSADRNVRTFACLSEDEKLDVLELTGRGFKPGQHGEFDFLILRSQMSRQGKCEFFAGLHPQLRYDALRIWRQKYVQFLREPVPEAHERDRTTTYFADLSADDKLSVLRIACAISTKIRSWLGGCSWTPMLEFLGRLGEGKTRNFNRLRPRTQKGSLKKFNLSTATPVQTFSEQSPEKKLLIWQNISGYRIFTGKHGEGKTAYFANRFTPHVRHRALKQRQQEQLRLIDNNRFGLRWQVIYGFTPYSSHLARILYPGEDTSQLRDMP